MIRLIKVNDTCMNKVNYLYMCLIMLIVPVILITQTEHYNPELFKYIYIYIICICKTVINLERLNLKPLDRLLSCHMSLLVHAVQASGT